MNAVNPSSDQVKQKLAQVALEFEMKERMKEEKRKGLENQRRLKEEEKLAEDLKKKDLLAAAGSERSKLKRNRYTDQEMLL